MHVSVVIPAYNEERSIAALLDRVLKARHASYQWDILVVDDDSADKTSAIVEKFKPDVRLIRHERNLGKG